MESDAREKSVTSNLENLVFLCCRVIDR